MIEETLMENATRGKLFATALIENLEDLFRVNTGDHAKADVRGVFVSCLIDHDAFGLSMPMRRITQLGLDPVRTQVSRTISGTRPTTIYRGVRLTIHGSECHGRDCIMDVLGTTDDLPVIIGQLPLAALNWIPDVDMKGRCSIGVEHSRGMIGWRDAFLDLR